jgi:hypothetical protein
VMAMGRKMQPPRRRGERSREESLEAHSLFPSFRISRKRRRPMRNDFTRPQEADPGT